MKFLQKIMAVIFCMALPAFGLAACASSSPKAEKPGVKTATGSIDQIKSRPDQSRQSCE